MSTVIVTPTTDPSQHDDWKKEITDTVNLFYERMNDACNIDTSTLRCLAYNIGDAVILLFPLHRLEDADEINDDDHLSMVPMFTVPSVEMTCLASEYLGIDADASDVMLQDLDLRSGLSLHERRIQKGNVRPTKTMTSDKILHVRKSDLERVISDTMHAMLHDLLDLSIESPDDKVHSTNKHHDGWGYVSPSIDLIEVDHFLLRHYRKDPDGAVSIKDVKRKPDYKAEYWEFLDIKQIPICKSCSGKWRKGCCKDYGYNSRTARMMVLGWASIM